MSRKRSRAEFEEEDGGGSNSDEDLDEDGAHPVGWEGVDLDEGVRLLQEEHAENMRSVEEIHALRLANVMAMYDAEKKQAEDEHKAKLKSFQNHMEGKRAKKVPDTQMVTRKTAERKKTQQKTTSSFRYNFQSVQKLSRSEITADLAAMRRSFVSRRVRTADKSSNVNGTAKLKRPMHVASTSTSTSAHAHAHAHTHMHATPSTSLSLSLSTGANVFSPAAPLSFSVASMMDAKKARNISPIAKLTTTTSTECASAATTTTTAAAPGTLPIMRSFMIRSSRAASSSAADSAAAVEEEAALTSSSSSGTRSSSSAEAVTSSSSSAIRSSSSACAASTSSACAASTSSFASRSAAALRSASFVDGACSQNHTEECTSTSQPVPLHLRFANGSKVTEELAATDSDWVRRANRQLELERQRQKQQASQSYVAALDEYLLRTAQKK